MIVRGNTRSKTVEKYPFCKVYHKRLTIDPGILNTLDNGDYDNGQ